RLASALRLNRVVPGIGRPHTVLGVVDFQRVEQRNGDVLGGEARRLGAALPEPLMPPAVLEDVPANFVALEAEGVLDEDVKLQPPLPRLGERLRLVDADQSGAYCFIEHQHHLTLSPRPTVLDDPEDYGAHHDGGGVAGEVALRAAVEDQ